MKELDPSSVLVHRKDGQDALDYLKGEGTRISPQPDVIVVDLKMPRMDGLELLNRIRAEPSFDPIPVVVLTGSDAESDILSAYRGGANLYLTKPESIDLMEELVRGLLRFIKIMSG